jgi:hypothetical protein
VVKVDVCQLLEHVLELRGTRGVSTDERDLLVAVLDAVNHHLGAVEDRLVSIEDRLRRVERFDERLRRVELVISALLTGQVRP